jgi:hypothetical protein
MANPNIVNVTDIRGKTDFLTVTTSALSFLYNPAVSGDVYKVNTVTVTNMTTDPIYVYLQIVRPIGAVPNTFILVNAVSAPANSVLVLVTRDAGFYLEEDDDLQIYASATGLRAMVSYEVIN